jgi:hypothetical protein
MAAQRSISANSPALACHPSLPTAAVAAFAAALASSIVPEGAQRYAWICDGP